MICIVLFPVARTLAAGTATQEGVTAALTAQDGTFAAGDEISLTVTVQNGYETAANDVYVIMHIPDELEIDGETEAIRTALCLKR